VNRIHPSAQLIGDVHLGEDNVIGPHAVLIGPVQLGSRNWIGPGVWMGTPGEQRGGPHPAGWDASDQPLAGVRVGDDTVIREGVSVQVSADSPTVIGSRCYLMTKSHVPHDAVLADDVTVAVGAVIGGHSVVLEGANIGLNAALHQFSVVGAGAMIGMGSIVTKHVPPFAMAFGVPAKVRGANRVGLSRRGVADTTIETLEQGLVNGELAPYPESLQPHLDRYLAAVAGMGH
jgi:UDP-N-acetylglucosamine acyltransferase